MLGLNRCRFLDHHEYSNQGWSSARVQLKIIFYRVGNSRR